MYQLNCVPIKYAILSILAIFRAVTRQGLGLSPQDVGSRFIRNVVVHQTTRYGAPEHNVKVTYDSLHIILPTP